MQKICTSVQLCLWDTFYEEEGKVWVILLLSPTWSRIRKERQLLFEGLWQQAKCNTHKEQHGKFWWMLGIQNSLKVDRRWKRGFKEVVKPLFPWRCSELGWIWPWTICFSFKVSFVLSSQLDQVISAGLFQLKLFYDSVINALRYLH